MGEDNNKSEERKFSQKQYDFLKKCSEEGEIDKWNRWRKENPIEEILLEDLDVGFFGANLEGVNLFRAHLKNAQIRHSNLKGADLNHAHLENVRVDDSNLEDVALGGAHLEDADLDNANLTGAYLERAHLERADIRSAWLEGAMLEDAHLEGTYFFWTYLGGANFKRTFVDGSTLFWECKVDKKTDFRGVGLDSCRIDAGTKQLLKYNIRRLNWEDWYKKHKFLRWPVKCFWGLSDYGLSTIRVISWFFVFALIFAGIYYKFPECLLVEGQVGNLRSFLHAFYFSVVTMTTLGFGDIHANPDNTCGIWLLIVQVLLGYVMLGALVTRLNIMFTTGGPARKFVKMRRKEKKATEKAKKKANK